MTYPVMIKGVKGKLYVREQQGLACISCGVLVKVRGATKQFTGGETIIMPSSYKTQAHLDRVQREIKEWVMAHKCKPESKLALKVGRINGVEK